MRVLGHGSLCLALSGFHFLRQPPGVEPIQLLRAHCCLSTSLVLSLRCRARLRATAPRALELSMGESRCYSGVAALLQAPPGQCATVTLRSLPQSKSGDAAPKRPKRPSGPVPSMPGPITRPRTPPLRKVWEVPAQTYFCCTCRAARRFSPLPLFLSPCAASAQSHPPEPLRQRSRPTPASTENTPYETSSRQHAFGRR